MPKITDPAILQHLNAGPQLVNPNPLYPLQMQQEQGQAAAAPYAAPKAAADVANAQVNAQVNQATAPAEIRQKNASASKAEIDLANTRQTGGASVEEAKAGSFYSRAANANNLYNQQGVGPPSMGRSIAKTLLPDTLVNNFTDPSRQQSEAAMRDFIAATLRYESGAAISPSEFENQAKIYFPISGDGPATIKFKAGLRDQAIKSLNIGSGVAANRVNPNAFDTATQQGNYFAPPEVSAATGKTVTEMDTQTASAVDQLVRMGRPYEEIAAYVADHGFKAPDPKQIGAAQQYMGSHPDYQGGFTQAQKTRPASQLEQLAASPLSAYFNGAGTALTAGFNDELAGAGSVLNGGDYTQGRDAFNAKKGLLADAHPRADFAGNLAGNILGMYGVNKAAGALAGRGSGIGTALTAKGGLGADAAYGAAYGAGQDNQNRLQGGVLGGLAAGAGNVAGRGIAAGLGGIVSPSGGALRPLYDMGVRPSLGQRMGGLANSAEEKLQSIPVVGDMIAGTRQRARDQFQVGVFNDSIGEIGAKLPDGTVPGNDPHRFAQGAFDNAYDSARSGMVAHADPDMGTAIGSLQARVGALRPNSQSQFNTVWRDAVARRFKGGSLAGDDYKKAMSEMGKKSAAIRKNQTGDAELADALDEAMGVLRDSAMRNSPPEAVAAMNAADKGYAKLVRIEDAAKRRGTGSGKFSPKQYDAAVQNMAGGVRSRGYLSGDALNSDIAQLGLRLGDDVPNSATFDRLAWAGGVGALGAVEPQTMSILAALGAVNAPGVRNLTTGLLAPRKGAGLNAAAERIRKMGPLLGSVGAGSGLALLPSR